MKQQLIPKQRRRKRQPSAEVMRQQLALAADEIIRLRAQFQRYELVDSIIGDSRGGHYPPERNPPPPYTPWHRDPDQSGYGRITYHDDKPARPWWRRIFRSKAA